MKSPSTYVNNQQAQSDPSKQNKVHRLTWPFISNGEDLISLSSTIVTPTISSESCSYKMGLVITSLEKPINLCEIKPIADHQKQK
jgi:hypothetical protein